MNTNTRKADALDAVGKVAAFLAVFFLLFFACWAFLVSDEHGVIPEDASFWQDLASAVANIIG